MRFLIDGYNLLHQLGLAGRHYGPRAWERSRHDLAAWVAKAHGKSLERVTIVFDAENAPAKRDPIQTIHGVRVRFAVGMLADDLLEEMIQRETQPRELTVVSSDQRVLTAGRRRGCAVMDCREYIDRAIDEGHALPQGPPPAAKPVDESKEEMDHWKRQFGAIDSDAELRRFNRPFEDFEKR